LRRLQLRTETEPVSKPLLCVTVTGATTAELCRQRDAVADADLVELRLDTVSDPSAAAALAARPRPVIVTCRPQWEGGCFQGSEEERKRILGDALTLGAEYVDLEWRANFDDLIARTSGRRIVLSTHDYDGVPIDLAARAQAMRTTGAEVIKIAATLRSLADAAQLLAVASETERPTVLIGMGPYGIVTRVLASRFRSAWTYAGALRQIGQLSAAELLEEYQFRSIADATQIYGVVGQSVAHSVSPAIHNAAFRASQYDAVYLPLPAVSAEDFHNFGRAIGISGASVTIPFKVSLFEHMDEVSAVARRIGAINTIKVVDGRWIGGNTDANGFLEPLQQRVPVNGLRAAVLGAGGGARAVVAALASTDCSISIHARKREQAEEIAMLSSAAIGPWPPDRGTWDVLVNCTPIGMFPHVDATPLPADRLTGRFVFDLVYNPQTTRLLREAQTAGCETIDGLEMLVAQAREQFVWWTGLKPAAGVMRDAALKSLSEYGHHENHVV